MSKYRIAYVDESESDTRRFQRFSFNFFDVVPVSPLASLDETCESIINSQIDAVIADFDLSEQNSEIHYDGTDLVRKILRKMDGFPVFILTSFEDDAINKGDDVNIVYEKKEMDQGENFLQRVKIQIEKYKHKIEREENRIIELLEESQRRKLTALEFEEIADLDSKIEKALDRESQIPNILRTNSEITELSELLKKVDHLSSILLPKK